MLSGVASELGRQFQDIHFTLHSYSSRTHLVSQGQSLGNCVSQLLHISTERFRMTPQLQPVQDPCYAVLTFIRTFSIYRVRSD